MNDSNNDDRKSDENLNFNGEKKNSGNEEVNAHVQDHIKHRGLWAISIPATSFDPYIFMKNPEDTNKLVRNQKHDELERNDNAVDLRQNTCSTNSDFDINQDLSFSVDEEHLEVEHQQQQNDALVVDQEENISCRSSSKHPPPCFPSTITIRTVEDSSFISTYSDSATRFKILFSKKMVFMFIVLLFMIAMFTVSFAFYQQSAEKSTTDVVSLTTTTTAIGDTIDIAGVSGINNETVQVLSSVPSTTISPTIFTSQIPSSAPSASPTTKFPSVLPTELPSKIPSSLPSTALTMIPSILPSHNPTLIPSIAPSSLPSALTDVQCEFDSDCIFDNVCNCGKCRSEYLYYYELSVHNFKTAEDGGWADFDSTVEDVTLFFEVTTTDNFLSTGKHLVMYDYRMGKQICYVANSFDTSFTLTSWMMSSTFGDNNKLLLNISIKENDFGFDPDDEYAKRNIAFFRPTFTNSNGSSCVHDGNDVYYIGKNVITSSEPQNCDGAIHIGGDWYVWVKVEKKLAR